MLFGDFNLPYICWNTLLATGPHARYHNLFLEFTSEHGLIQCVAEPTRENNILDLILVSDPLLINSCVTTAPLGNSDHNIVEFNLVLPTDNIIKNNINDDAKQYCYNFKEADFEGLNNFLIGVDWQSILCSDNANDCMETFINILNIGIDEFVPVKPVSTLSCPSHDRKYNRLYPLYIRQLFGKKRAAWRLYKQYKTEKLKSKYKAAEQKFSAAVESFYEAKENEIIKSANLGSFYRYVNNKLVTKSGVGALKDSNGDLVHDDSDKARVINDFYSNIFTKDNNVLPDFQSRVHGDANLNNIDFNSSIVL